MLRSHIDAMSTAPPESPRFFGRYELVHLLGQGGMGEVYLAKLTGAAGFEKPCIVKTILPALVKDRQFLDRFHHEAKVLVHLVHSSIAQVYDMGEADGTYYMALEYVAGVDLGYLLEQARVQGRSVPAPVALYIGQRMAEGLGYAHRKTGPEGDPLGIVHRDVSPHNVMVSYEGEVKVIDFGLAKSTARSKYTLPATVMGKLGYMSPEQVRAEPLDHRSDIYSCAVVVWEMLAGRGLVPHGTVGEMMAAMSNPVVPPLADLRPDVDPSLEGVLRRALAPVPAERYLRADDFGRALNAELLRTGAAMGAEEVGEFVRALCPEAFAEQRKLASNVAGERRTPPPVARSASGSGTGMYGEPGAGPESGAAFQATAVRTSGDAAVRRDTGRIEPELTRGPSGTFVSGGAVPAPSTRGSGGVARSDEALDASALGATAVHRVSDLQAAAGAPAEQALEKPERRRPLAQIAVAALLLVGATVGITTYVIHANTLSTAVAPTTPVTPTEPVVAAPEPTPVVTPPPEVTPPPDVAPVVAENAVPDAGVEPVPVEVPSKRPDVKVASASKTTRRTPSLVAVNTKVAPIDETSGGQRVVKVDAWPGLNSGAVLQVVGAPVARGSNKRPLLGSARVEVVRHPNRDQFTVRLDEEADAAKGTRYVVLDKRPSTPVMPEPVVQPLPEEKPAAPRRLLGSATTDGLLGFNVNRTLTIINEDSIPWTECKIILHRRQQAGMTSLKSYGKHIVKTGKPYFNVQSTAPEVPLRVVRVICKEGQGDFVLDD
ncbi:serine/threonine protein kinase [Corallococcus terminator]|nr:serine/threonine-protein kinase [Corallococcus terminator]